MRSISMSSPKIQFLIVFSLMSLIIFINSSIEQLIAFFGKTLIICLVSYVITVFMKRFRAKQKVSSKGKAVLITGIVIINENLRILSMNSSVNL